jgi:P27 family predicted phage terminase small subunit
MNTVRHRPPRHLSDASRKWFAQVSEAYDLESHHLRILQAAAEAWDRAQAARELVTAEGLVVTSRLGERKPHPAVAIERDARAAFLRATRELGLDLDQPGAAEMPRAKRKAPAPLSGALSTDQFWEIALGPSCKRCRDDCRGRVCSAFDSPFLRKGAYFAHRKDDFAPETTNPGTRPWGFWEYETDIRPHPRTNAAERAALEKLGKLTPDEAAVLAAWDADDERDTSG